MPPYSEKTNQWIIGYLLFNLFALIYIYLFFFDGFISTSISVIVPLIVWEILLFGVLAPDEVFVELFGELNVPTSTSRGIQSPILTVRDELVSSGDH